MRRNAIALLIALAILTTQHSVAIAQLYGNRLASKDGRWLLPVASLHLTSTERDHISRGSVQAWDITAPQGTPIFPVEDGVVEYAGCNNSGGYGCWTLIRHDSGIKTIMGHMINGSITVKAGQRVAQWDVVGQVGWTGMTSFGPHVHLEIHKPDGGRFNIADFWDIRQMHYQKLGNAQGSEVITEIGVAGATKQATPQQAAGAAESRLLQLLRKLAQMPAEQLSGAVFMLTMAAGFVLWLAGLWVRIVLVSAGSAMAGALVIALLLAPATLQANQAMPTVSTVSGDWEKAYQVTQGREGWKCTNDGAYTMGGVTQGTYNRWRAKHGNGPADVCANLTREQAKSIFYELFWQPIGAEGMPFALALSAVDHYYNTGKVIHLLTQCGHDVRCFNQARIADYRTKSNCYLYCVAWINRVNHIRTLTEK